MITIEYNETGECVSDFDIGAFVKRVAGAPEGAVFTVANGTPLHAVRLAIVSGGLDAKAIYFRYENRTFQANEYGAIMDWPDGWSDMEGRICEDILRAAMKKRKAEKAKLVQEYTITLADTWKKW